MNPQVNYGWTIVVLGVLVILFARLRRSRTTLDARVVRASWSVRVLRIAGALGVLAIVATHVPPRALRGEATLHRLASAARAGETRDRTQILFVVSDAAGAGTPFAIFERIVDARALSDGVTCEPIGFTARLVESTGLTERWQSWSRGRFADESVPSASERAPLDVGDGVPFGRAVAAAVGTPIRDALTLRSCSVRVEVFDRALAADERLEPVRADSWLEKFERPWSVTAKVASGPLETAAAEFEDPLRRLSAGRDGVGTLVLLTLLFLCSTGSSLGRSAAVIVLGGIAALGAIARLDLSHASELVRSANPLERRAGIAELASNEAHPVTAAERLRDAFVSEGDGSIRAAIVAAAAAVNAGGSEFGSTRALIEAARQDRDERVRASADEARRLLDARANSREDH